MIKARRLYEKALQYKKEKKFQLFYDTLEEAVIILQKLSDQHSAPAAYSLGRIYFQLFKDLDNKENILQNKLFLKAYHYLTLSYNRGSPRAKNMLDHLRTFLTEEEYRTIEQEGL